MPLRFIKWGRRLGIRGLGSEVKSMICFEQAGDPGPLNAECGVGMISATSQGVVLDLSNKLAKYLGEGTSRRAAEGNFRCFSF